MIAKHWHIENRAPRFVLSSMITPVPNAENMEIMTEINILDLDDLAGTDQIRSRDTVFVHMAMGPENIAYPFAITRDKPHAKSDNYAFYIKGQVVDVDSKIATIRYNFETFLPSRQLGERIGQTRNPDVQIELAVNDQAVARLVAVQVDGTKYPYRVIERPVLGRLSE